MGGCFGVEYALAGHLRISRANMTVDASRLMPIAGWIQLGIFSSLCIGMIFQVAFSGAPEWKQGLGQTTLAAFWFSGSAILRRHEKCCELQASTE